MTGAEKIQLAMRLSQEEREKEFSRLRQKYPEMIHQEIVFEYCKEIHGIEIPEEFRRKVLAGKIK